ncbi:hypothetical protein C8R44DRAFT_868787 [Mycena epipterygia]|nr:hypothetical protein C8R44DRAFT_868787 [Mycena epipterygia]
MGISLSTQYVPSWQDSCAATFNCTSEGLVNKLGETIIAPAACLTNGSMSPEVWGITAKVCQENCGTGILRQVRSPHSSHDDGSHSWSKSVEFSPSAVTIATWLLPWVALIAQLPFEASGWMDLLSGFLCVGSPVLAAYSLALTAFNRRHISHKFRQLRNRAKQDTHDQYHYMVQRVDAAAFILQEAQQCPMRANQRNGELARLIVLNGEHIDNFWQTAAKDLKNTRRGFTYSFLAQGKNYQDANSDTEEPPIVLLAFLTYLISFITAVHDSLGSPDVGLQFASSTVWSWMFPIVFGYIGVGSQYEAGSIEDALTGNRIMPDPDAAGEVQYVYQKGLCPNADLYTPLTHLDPHPPTTPAAAASHTGPVARTPNRSSMEDAILLSDRSGVPSSSNYASTSQLALHTLSVHDDHDTQPLLDPPAPPPMVSDHDDHSTQPLSHPQAPPTSTTSDLDDDSTQPLLHPPTWWGFDVRGDERREGPIFTYARIFTSFACTEHVGRGFAVSIEKFRKRAPIPEGAEEAANSCGFQPREDLPAFTPWSQIPTPAIQHMFGATIVALFLQWGSTGAAIYVAYNTPVVGLGCRSGSYLIYGIAATLSWAMLVFSHLVSHAFMQRFEQDPEHPRKGVIPMGALAGLAVITRFTGQAIAVSNALWLIVSSVLEDIGTFHTCWCETDAFQYGANGWAAVFKGAVDFRATATGIWIGGFMLSLAVSVIVSGFFAYHH